MSNKLTIFLTVAAFMVGGWFLAGDFLPSLSTAWARGGMGYGGGCPMRYQGTPGGRDFAPGGGYGNRAVPNNGRVALSPERARDIAANHVSRQAPGLTLGQGRDQGAYYEFDVMAKGKVVDRLGVDKSSGLVRPVQ